MAFCCFIYPVYRFFLSAARLSSIHPHPRHIDKAAEEGRVGRGRGDEISERVLVYAALNTGKWNLHVNKRAHSVRRCQTLCLMRALSSPFGSQMSSLKEHVSNRAARRRSVCRSGSGHVSGVIYTIERGWQKTRSEEIQFH